MMTGVIEFQATPASEWELYERERIGVGGSSSAGKDEGKAELARLCSIGATEIPNNVHNPATCDICDLMNSVMGASVKVKTTHYHQPSKPRIQKVSQRLREVQTDSKCFDPVLVSIGPYHHGKPEYQMTEKLKYEAARRIVSYCGDNIEFLYNQVSGVVHLARDCYASDIRYKYDDSQLARMMFLDGCFVLDFITCSLQGNRFDLIGNWSSTAFIRSDLFLLENQLPFFVLEALMKVRFNGTDEGRRMMTSFIDKLVLHSGGKLDKPYPFHLQQEPFHLLDLLRTSLFGTHPDSPVDSWHLNVELVSFRSVKELKGVGITFKKSNTNGLSDISFQPGNIYGEFSLPQIAINDSTKSLLLNLAAYEMSPDASLDYVAISYICLMDELINDAEDVKELRSKDIIVNFLGSDDQVADLFNQLHNQLVQDPTIYASVKKEIEKHCEKKLALALVSFFNTNFTSWTSMGVIAASLALILSFLQTFYTIRG